MRRVLLSLIVLLITTFAFSGLIGCSGSDVDPVSPVESSIETGIEGDVDSIHSMWGLWSFDFDEDRMTIDVVPLRNLEAHLNVTPMITPPECADCVSVQVNSFDIGTRILDADVTLKNPYPISGYDVRGILYTNDAGHKLVNADAWTSLWDILGGGGLNPFKAFAKGETNRKFTGVSEHTVNYQIYIPQPPQYAAIKYAIDASYPGNCKEPYAIDHFVQMGELYDYTGSSVKLRVDVLSWFGDVSKVTLVAPAITGESFTQFSTAGEATWELILSNNTGVEAGDYTVRLIASTAGLPNLPLHHYVNIVISEPPEPEVTGINPASGYRGDDLIGVTVTGTGFQGPGAQVMLLKSLSPDILATNVEVISLAEISCDISIPLDSILGLYDVSVRNGSGLSDTGEQLFEVQEHIPNPVEITPPWLNIQPYYATIAGNWLYVSGGDEGLHIFDITDDSNPVWVNKIMPENCVSECYVGGLATNGSYLYSADSYDGLRIYDLSIPESPILINTVPPTVWFERIEYSGGYLYANYQNKLDIIDVDPPETASVVKTVELLPSGYTYQQCYSGGYIYACGNDGVVKIVDVDPVTDASVVGTIVMPGPFDVGASDVAIDGYFAYVAGGEWQSTWGVHRIDLLDISNPVFKEIIPGTENARRVEIIYSGNDTVLIVTSEDGFQVFDATDPQDIFLQKTIPVDTGQLRDISSVGNYVIGIESAITLRLLDVSNVSDVHEVSKIYSPGHAQSMELKDNMLYQSCAFYGFNLVDVSNPQIPIMRSRFGPTYAQMSIINDGQAYITTYDVGLQIVDVTDPFAPGLVNLVAPPDMISGVDYANGYLYVSDIDVDEFHVYDVDPVDAAHTISTISLPTRARDVIVKDGYAYAAGYTPGGLYVIDISVPGSESVVHTVPIGGYILGMDLVGDYIYTAESVDGKLSIIDISDPLTANIVKSVALDTDAGYDVVVQDGFAYVLENNRVTIIDIDPAAEASILTSVEVPIWQGCVAVQDNVLYAAGRTLRVFELW